MRYFLLAVTTDIIVVDSCYNLEQGNNAFILCKLCTTLTEKINKLE